MPAGVSSPLWEVSKAAWEIPILLTCNKSSLMGSHSPRTPNYFRENLLPSSMKVMKSSCCFSFGSILPRPEIWRNEKSVFSRSAHKVQIGTLGSTSVHPLLFLFLRLHCLGLLPLPSCPWQSKVHWGVKWSKQYFCIQKQNKPNLGQEQSQIQEPQQQSEQGKEAGKREEKKGGEKGRRKG